MEETTVGYLFNYHFGTAAHVGTGNFISRLPAILGLLSDVSCDVSGTRLPEVSRVHQTRGILGSFDEIGKVVGL